MKELFLKGQGLLYLTDLWFESLFEGVELNRPESHFMTSLSDNETPWFPPCQGRCLAHRALTLNLSLMLALWRIHIAEAPKQCNADSDMRQTKILTEGKEWLTEYKCILKLPTATRGNENISSFLNMTVTFHRLAPPLVFSAWGYAWEWLYSNTLFQFLFPLGR